MQKPKIIAIVGSTASGKTALSIELAKRYNGEIISCDSMQIYRRMDIGTAKPDESEKQGIPHHMIDIIEPNGAFSCADYAEMAKKIIFDIISRGKTPILCGGTGLYLDGVLRGGSFEVTEVDEDYRRELDEIEVSAGGVDKLYEMLLSVDPESAAATHRNNVKRVKRALEIYHTSGVPKSELDRRSREVESEFDATVIGLKYNDRDLLYRRVDMRVDDMVRRGLLDEVRALESEGIFDGNATAAQAIGYKELLGYIRGECSLITALEELKKATRRYAKRQITWFSAKDYVRWINADEDREMRSFDCILCDAQKILDAEL